MMRPLIRRLSALTKSAPLRLILVVPFVLQIALVVGLTAWLLIQNGYQAVNEVVGQFRNETSNHIQQYLETYVATPHIINRLNADMLHLQHLSLQDLPSLEHYLWYQMQAFDSVNEIKFGTEQGGFVAVEKLADGSLVSKMASRATGSVYRVYILDQQGQRTRLVDQRPNYDPRRRPWYKGAAASGKATLVNIYQRFSTPRSLIDVITTSLPLYDEQKNFVGIASVDLTLSDISQFLHDLRIGRSSQTFIVDRSGLLIGSSTTQQIFDRQGQSVQQIKATDSQDVLTRFAARSLLNHFGNWAQITTGQQLDFNLNGERQFVQVKPLRDDKGLDWLIVLVVPEDDFTDRINANTQTAILLCMAAFTVATGLGIYTARGITTPIFRLSRAAQAIARGNLDQTVRVKGAIEINVLAQSFNQMAQQLRDSFAQLARTNEALELRVEQRTTALQASEAKFAAAFHASPHPICISTFAEGRFIEVNESFCRISEYCLEEIIGRTSTELNFWQPEDRARMTQSLQEKRAVRNQETEVCVNSGCIRTVLLSAELIELNGQTCILLVAADITERKHMEAALQRSEEKYRNLVKTANSIINRFDTQGRIRYINDYGLKFFGYEEHQILGRTLLDTIVPETETSGRDLKQFIHDLCDNPGSYLQNENENLCRDGRRVWVAWSNQAILNEHGDLVEILSVGHDITQRKQAEEALQRSEAKFRNIFENSQVGIFRTRLSDGLILDANQRLANLFGFDSPEEVIGLKHTTDCYVNPSDRQQAVELLKRHGELQNFEVQLRKRDGTLFWGLYSSRLNAADGYMEGVIADISDRKQAEAALRESEQLLDVSFSQSLDGFFIMMLDQPVQWDSSIDKDKVLDYVFEHQRITKINDAMLAQYGASREQFIDITPNDLYAHDLAYGKNVWRRFFDAGKLHIETDERRLDGTAIWVEGNYICLYDSQGRIMGHFGVQRDISDRKRAEAALRDREQELRLITDALPVCISYVDANGRYRFVNRTYEVWFSCSRDEILGKSVREFLGEAAYQVVQPYVDRALAGQRVTYEAEIPYLVGKKYVSATFIPDFDRNNRMRGKYGLIEDISDRKRAEEASILEERNRMAREIHDTLAQAFTGILIQVGAATQVLTDDSEATLAHLDMIEELARTGLSEARRSVRALRPQLLESGDLSSALHRLVNQMRAATDTALIYEIQGIAYPLSAEIENNLLRIGQEALTNAIKHAGASKIGIELVYDDAQCSLRVKDDGQGFGVVGVPHSGGFGLLGISERAERIGAQLSIGSQPGQGTEIVVIVNP